MKSSVASIETFSTVDGPGIRTTVFFNECHLRCIYCHNPEMWNKGKANITDNELVKKILNNKEYFGEDGGVTFSGGEPLLQNEFLISVCKKLKKHNIHIALDTAGIGIGNYENILKYIDLIMFDVKHTNKEGYKLITKANIDKVDEFINVANKLNKKFWIRQVIVPGITDSIDYIKELKEYIKIFKNVLKVEFLPFHKMGEEKYFKLGIVTPLKDVAEMDKEKCEKLYNIFLNL